MKHENVCVYNAFTFRPPIVEFYICVYTRILYNNPIFAPHLRWNNVRRMFTAEVEWNEEECIRDWPFVFNFILYSLLPNILKFYKTKTENKTCLTVFNFDGPQF